MPTRKNPHFPTGLVPTTTNTAKIIGTNLRNKKKQNINKMRARVGLILRIGWILNEIPAVVTGSCPGSADSGGNSNLSFGELLKKRLASFQFNFLSCAEGGQRVSAADPLSIPAARGSSPSGLLRRGRVPVKLKLKAIRRQGWGSKISPFCSALPAARRKSKGH